MKVELGFVHIPAGEFIIGSKRSKDPQTGDDEMPQHVLEIADYFIMRCPVTNAHYQQFMDATGHRAPLFWSDGRLPVGQADHPVVGVNFGDAAAFCMWARQAMGLAVRLPTEAEWEKAARGPDGRVYPWGNRWEDGRCNSAEAKIGGTTPVGQFSPDGDSPFGVAEMGGNVQEWVASIYAPYPYDAEDGRESLLEDLTSPSLMPRLYETGNTSNPNAMEATIGKTMLRGGSWRESKAQSRCAYRSWAAPMHRSVDTGFRCCYE